MTYGACVTHLYAPDRDGRHADVVLGYSQLEDYLAGDAYVGATIGRVANRIAGACFALDDQTHKLCANDGINHLHGGVRGFDKAVWKVASSAQEPVAKLVLTHCSHDGEEGYPGTLNAKVSFTVTDQNEVIQDYEAIADKPTPVNLTNHTYFNLAGRGTVLDHLLKLNACRYTPLDVCHIPTGEIAPVSGTGVDFCGEMRIGLCLNGMADGSSGLNLNYVLNDGSGPARFAARLHEPASGRSLDLFTTQPGIQLYAASYMRPVPAGKHGLAYGPYSGVCLEPQHFPNAINQTAFPSVILRPGKRYEHRTVWKFSAV